MWSRKKIFLKRWESVESSLTSWVRKDQEYCCYSMKVVTICFLSKNQRKAPLSWHWRFVYDSAGNRIVNKSGPAGQLSWSCHWSSRQTCWGDTGMRMLGWPLSYFASVKVMSMWSFQSGTQASYVIAQGSPKHKPSSGSLSLELGPHHCLWFYCL